MRVISTFVSAWISISINLCMPVGLMVSYQILMFLPIISLHLKRPWTHHGCGSLVLQNALIDFPSALAPGGIPAAIISVVCLKVNLVRSTLEGLRGRDNNNSHSRVILSCIWCKKIHPWLGGSNVHKTSLSDSFSVSVFLIYLIGLYRKAYMCSPAELADSFLRKSHLLKNVI